MSRRTDKLHFILLLGLCSMGGGTGRELGAEMAELFWSFQPVRTTAPPVVRRAEWPQSQIDCFILAKLEEHGLEPSGPADKRTLIRRASIDLTGLPPAPAEIEAFLEDESSEAFAKV